MGRFATSQTNSRRAAGVPQRHGCPRGGGHPVREAPMIFADRGESGRALAAELARQIPDEPGAPRPLVLALPRGGVPVAVPVAERLPARPAPPLPRGGVPVAVPVAERLGADLDVVVARKIGAPGHAEYGVGAIAEDGPPVF